MPHLDRGVVPVHFLVNGNSTVACYAVFCAHNFHPFFDIWYNVVAFDGLIKMLSCVCPHVGEEIWQRMGHDDTIAFEPWPVYDEAKTVEDTVEIAVQINGKTKGTLAIGKQDPKDEVIAKAKDVIADKLTGNIVKEIYVPGRIVNIVMK